MDLYIGAPAPLYVTFL